VALRPNTDAKGAGGEGMGVAAQDQPVTVFPARKKKFRGTRALVITLAALGGGGDAAILEEGGGAGDQMS